MKKDYEREARRERRRTGRAEPSRGLVLSAILPEYCVRRMSNFANICSLYLTVRLKITKIVSLNFMPKSNYNADE